MSSAADDQPRRGLLRPAAPEQWSPAPVSGPTPQPELDEPRLEDPSLADLSFADYKAIVVRAGKEFLEDNAMMMASALAYSTFFAIPSVILVVVGLFTLVAGPGAINTVVAHLHGVMPGQATTLLDGSLKRLDSHPAQSIAMTAVGLVLALWTLTGAMNAYMTAVNLMYERKDRRSFLRKRLVALQMVAVMGFAFLLVAVLLIFGPVIETHVGHALHASGLVSWIWWVAQWPVLLIGLLVAFATLLYLGPDVDHPKWQFLTPGSVLAVVIWLATSGLFALYTSSFASYNKTWGSLSAVIVMLTWLWLTGLAILFGAELNAESERSRELRRGEPASADLAAPAKS